MPRYDVDIPHTLTPETVKERLDSATAKLESSYGAVCRWQSARQLNVSRKGLDATVAIEDTHVHVTLELGFLLVPFSGTIREKLTRELTGLLAA